MVRESSIMKLDQALKPGLKFPSSFRRRPESGELDLTAWIPAFAGMTGIFRHDLKMHF